MNKFLSLWHKLTIRNITVKSLRQVQGIDPKHVQLMSIAVDRQDRPEMLIVYQRKGRRADYHFPLYEGFQVHLCNEFLRSLDTGIEVKFSSYRQYIELIDRIFSLAKG